MQRSPEIKRQQLADRLVKRAKRDRLAASEAAECMHRETLRARAASPRNPLTECAAAWNNYIHLPTVWADLARKPLYDITALEVADLLASTIRTATRCDENGRRRVVISDDSVFVLVAREALPFAVEFHSTWVKYWKQQA